VLIDYISSTVSYSIYRQPFNNELATDREKRRREGYPEVAEKRGLGVSEFSIISLGIESVKGTLIKKIIKFSSYTGKSRWERLQSHT
jgi:hypothetical protein